MDFLEYKSAKNARYLNSKKKGYYVWRTRKDNKVRSRHAKLEGRVFNWDDIPPDGFHPGEDYGCRCKAVPIDDELAYERLGKVEEVINLRTNPELTAEDLGIDDSPIEPAYPIESAIISGRWVWRAGKYVYELVNGTISEGQTVLKRPKGIPKDWIVKPNKKGSGVKYVDPNNNHNIIRFSRAKPNSTNPGQRYDNVKIQKSGKFLDKYGNVVPEKSIDSHIPIGQFRFNPEIFK